LSSIVVGPILTNDASVLTLLPGAAVEAASISVGKSINTLGTVNHQAGKLTTPFLTVGGGGEAQYNLTDGVVTTGSLILALAGVGSMTQSGGTVETSALYLGGTASAVGTYNLEGGALRVASGGPDGAKLFAVGTDGTGIFNQSGGLVVADSDILIADDGGVRGVYNLAGGTLDLQGHSILRGAGSAAFNMTGGVLKDPAELFPFEQLGGRLELSGLENPTTTRLYRFGPLATMAYDIRGVADSDLLVLTDGINQLAGQLDVLVDPAIDPATLVGTEFTVIRNLVSPIVGEFAGLPEGAVFGVAAGSNQHYFRITYNDGSNNVVLTSVVPEPSTLLLAGCGLAALVAFRRRREYR
jgi:hypothetical protein